MKLLRFRVTNFRSVEDSGWVEAEEVTALIGTNESGKTNVLLPLWKLNPAKEGAIIPTADYPRKHYNSFRHQSPKPIFIEAIFDLGDKVAAVVAQKTSMPEGSVRCAKVSRRFDGEYEVDFPDAEPPRAVERDKLLKMLGEAEKEIGSMAPLKTEEGLKDLLISSIKAARSSVAGDEEVGGEALEKVLAALDGVRTDGAPKTSAIVPRHQRLSEQVRELHSRVFCPHPREVEGAVEEVLSNMPKFVYYSTYGNLDSEIYLPQVIENLSRKGLGAREEARARTLKVLFEFVKLHPQEILELGRDFRDPSRQPTSDEVAAIAEKKKQRSILLQSASTLLTTQFRNWWKQGNYRFRFEADGDHFRIWVSDDKRPEEVELEGRSTGLQWFLSFYLVFLVERADAHEGAILLLDEPGLSLHPLAQRDLSQFFQGLAQDNQLLYTCHSPFLVDADRLDRVRKVYVDTDGTSRVTSDLSAVDGDIAQRGAAYAVHAALGLSVAESLLLGCEPVIVEGPSDQHYLSGIKNVLIATGQLRPGRELVFPPGGGTKGVKAVASILAGRDGELPLALFDSDKQGHATAESLRKGLYTGQPEIVLEIGDFVDLPESEVEDLIPPELIARELDRWQRSAEVPFADVMKTGMSIVPQIESWAEKEGIRLQNPGWKVELAKRVKRLLLAEGPKAVSKEVLERWAKLFDAFNAKRANAEVA